MKPSTGIAVQFALWAFFFSRIIPFAGDFLLPVMWIYDRRVFIGYLAVYLVEVAVYLPGAAAVIPLNRFQQLPSWEVTYIIPLSLIFITGGTIFSAWLGAWGLKRKMRKIAPDLMRVLKFAK